MSSKRALWIGLACLVVAVGALERWGVPLAGDALRPAGAARWIWRAADVGANDPVTFFAGRDFELAALPQTLVVQIAADEEYVLYCNGFRIGSASYASRPELDAYDVSRYARRGRNRLWIEVRSGRGAGGLLAAMFAGDDRPFLVTDGQWRVFDQGSADLRGGVAGLSGGRDAYVWRRPPTGRWPSPRLGEVGATYDEVARPPLLAATLVQRTELGSSQRWLFELPAERDGYLVLDYEASGAIRLDLYPETAGTSVTPRPYALPPGAGRWHDAVARRHHRVELQGSFEHAELHLLPADPAVARQEEQRAVRRRSGVWGLQPPGDAVFE